MSDDVYGGELPEDGLNEVLDTPNNLQSVRTHGVFVDTWGRRREGEAMLRRMLAFVLFLTEIV